MFDKRTYSHTRVFEYEHPSPAFNPTLRAPVLDVLALLKTNTDQVSNAELWNGDVDSWGYSRRTTLEKNGETTVVERTFDRLYLPPLAVDWPRPHARWLLGRLGSKTITFDDGESISSTYRYDSVPGCSPMHVLDTTCETLLSVGAVAESGALTKLITSTGDPWSVVTKQFGYDSYGNVILNRLASTDDFLDNREIHTSFDELDHIFPELRFNGLGHVSQTHWDGQLGVVISQADATGAWSQQTYDGLGRPTRNQVFGSDGVESLDDVRVQYLRTEADTGDSPLPSATAMVVRTDTGSGQWQESYLSARGFPLRTRWGSDNAVGTSKRLYWYHPWVEGQIKKVYEPVADTEPDYAGAFAEFEHDASGRVISTVAPGGAEFRTEYKKRATLSYDAEANPPTRHDLDADGRIVRVQDPAGGTMCYSYDARSNLDVVTRACDTPGGPGVLPVRVRRLSAEGRRELSAEFPDVAPACR